MALFKKSKNTERHRAYIRCGEYGFILYQITSRRMKKEIVNKIVIGLVLFALFIGTLLIGVWSSRLPSIDDGSIYQDFPP